MIVSSFGRDFELATTDDGGIDFPSELVSLDWEAKRIENQASLRPLVMSVARHYGREEFDRFVLGLRQYYRGDKASSVDETYGKPEVIAGEKWEEERRGEILLRLMRNYDYHCKHRRITLDRVERE